MIIDSVTKFFFMSLDLFFKLYFYLSIRSPLMFFRRFLISFFIILRILLLIMGIRMEGERGWEEKILRRRRRKRKRE